MISLDIKDFFGGENKKPQGVAKRLQGKTQWGGNTLTSNTSWKAVAGSDSVAFI